MEEYNKPPTAEEVERALNSMPDGKASGSDGIATELLKQREAALEEALLWMMLLIWSNKKVPRNFKIAYVIESRVYKKKGNKLSMTVGATKTSPN